MSLDAIFQFWAFWRASQAEIDRAAADRALDEWVGPISRHVDAIHPDIDWEMGAGIKARHYFCLSGCGDMERRVVCERWRSAGPGDGEVFEFHAARPGGGYAPGLVLKYEGLDFDEAGFRFALEVDEIRRTVHLQVHHPGFREAEEPVRMGATFVTLDSVLGEDEVERWIGGVELSEAPLEGAGDFAAVLDAVAGLRSGASEPSYTLLQAERAGEPVIALADLGLKRVDHLLFDTHYEVVLPIQAPTPRGLTTDEEGAELQVLEDRLLEVLGPDAIWVGHETGQGRRVIHLHAAATGPVPARLDAWGAEVAAERDVEVRARHDPAWEVLRRW